MYTVLVVLMVIASLLMCFIVLIQESKGGGLASSFSSSNQIMGVRKTTDLIEKITWSLAIMLVVLSVLSSYFIPKAVTERSVIMKDNITVPALPAAPKNNAAPVQQATPQQAPAAAQPAQEGNAAPVPQD